MNADEMRVVFEEAAEALVVASRDLADGHLFVVPSNIALALNRLFGALFPEESRPTRRQPGEKALSVYNWRWAQVEKCYGVTAERSQAIHDLRLEGAYPRRPRADPRSRFTETKIAEALDEAWQILSTVAATCSEPIPSAVAESMRRAGEPTPERLMLEDLEHRVQWALYDPGLRARLNRFELELRGRNSTGALRHRGHILAMLCQDGQNQTTPASFRRARSLGEEAYGLLSYVRDRAGVVYVRNTMSTLALIQPTPDIAAAQQFLDEAASWAGDDASMMLSVTRQRAGILRAMNRGLDAAELVKRDLAWARSQGQTAVGWQEMIIGWCIARSGDLSRALDMIREGEEKLPVDFVAAHCIGANVLADICARMCLDKEAVAWGDVAARHATERGLWYQARILRATMRRHPSIWREDQQGGIQ